MAVQAFLGSDIAMAFDECPPAGAPRADLETAVERTARWAERCVAAPRPEGQLRFGIAQGGVDRELRARSAGHLASLPFDGYAIGGLSVGEEREEMFDVTASTAAAPAAAPSALLHGHRRPRGHPARDRRRDRHVRLRAADAARPHGLGHDLGGPPQPPQRALRPRRPPAAGGLRVPGLYALLPRLYAASRDPGRAARPAPADAAQPLVPARVVPCGTPCDHRAPLPGVLRGGTRATWLGDGAEGAGRG